MAYGFDPAADVATETRRTATDRLQWCALDAPDRFAARPGEYWTA